jgi:hypothetical protein
MNKLKIFEHNLIFLKDLLDFECVYFIEDLEIEPFKKFSPEFSSEYWFLKYNLIKDGKYLIDDNFSSLFKEIDINIIWMTLSDLENFNLKCIDGTWFLEVLEENIITDKIINILNSKNW